MAIELSRRGFLAGLATVLGAIGVPAGAVKLIAAPMGGERDTVTRAKGDSFRKRLIEEIRFPMLDRGGKFVILGAGVPSALQGYGLERGPPYASITYGPPVNSHQRPMKQWLAAGTPIEIDEDAILQMGYMAPDHGPGSGLFEIINHPIEIEMVVRDIAKFGRERKFMERHIIKPGQDHSLVEVRL